eukprot:jgi/Chlat1/3970/Chrsp26S04221
MAARGGAPVALAGAAAVAAVGAAAGVLLLGWHRDGNRAGGGDGLEASSEPGGKLQWVAGLRNAGNNCFLNVVLQALSSCGSVLRMLEEHAFYTEKTPLLDALGFTLAELARPVKHGTVISPKQVMKALAAYVPHFELHHQQDAAEALTHLITAMRCELDEQLQTQTATANRRLSIASLTTPADGYDGSCNGVRQLHFKESVSRALDLATESSSSIQQLCKYDEEVEAANNVQRSVTGTLASTTSAGAAMSRDWFKLKRQATLSPLQGLLANSLSCFCGHEYVTQFSPFSVLPLHIPLDPRTGDVKLGTTLLDCLQRFTATEVVEGVACTHCSHLATARALASNEEAKLQHNQVLKTLLWCRVAQGCDCQRVVHQAGLPWHSVGAKACKKMTVGRFPPVLCLQLQRSTVSPAGRLHKAAGHVSFPATLNAGQLLAHSFETLPNQALVGLDTAAAAMLTGQAARSLLLRQMLQTGSMPGANHAPTHLYNLVAVVVHFGTRQSGHYTVFRTLKAVGKEQQQQWFSVSDTRVRQVTFQEVEAAEASLLLYEAKRWR